jgi:hypothetical protein
MFSIARPRVTIVFILAAILLVACEAADATPTPRPTRTPRPATATSVPTPTLELVELTDTPSPTVATPDAPGATSAQPTPRPAAPQNPQVVPANDPLIPVFGPFPPKPIPSRPANVNPLTGLVADPAALARRPIVARIGNDQIVRTSFWHAGLSAADLVFEELIDILGNAYAHTRYSAVFLSNDPPLIGPIRSGRLINLQIAPMLDGALVHAGASNGTRWIFSQTPMINLDEYFNMPAYCYNKTHGYQGRLYATGPRLREWLRSKGWEKAVPLYGFTFSDRAPSGQPATQIGITQLPWPSWSKVQWLYDASSGKYSRVTTGTPHMDNSYTVTAKWGSGADCVITGSETRTQIRATNVVVLFARHDKTQIIEDSNNAVSVYIALTGQGDAQIFRDGVVVHGKWQRKSEQEFFEFVDASGNIIPLKPGNTWFEIVPIGYPVDVR